MKHAALMEQSWTRRNILHGVEPNFLSCKIASEVRFEIKRTNPRQSSSARNVKANSSLHFLLALNIALLSLLRPILLQ